MDAARRFTRCPKCRDACQCLLACAMPIDPSCRWGERATLSIPPSRGLASPAIFRARAADFPPCQRRASLFSGVHMGSEGGRLCWQYYDIVEGHARDSGTLDDPETQLQLQQLAEAICARYARAHDTIIGASARDLLAASVHLARLEPAPRRTLRWEAICGVCQQPVSSKQPRPIHCRACGARWEGWEVCREGVAAETAVGAAVPIGDLDEFAAAFADAITASRAQPRHHVDSWKAEAIERLRRHAPVAARSIHVKLAARLQQLALISRQLFAFARRELSSLDPHRRQQTKRAPPAQAPENLAPRKSSRYD